VQVQVVHAASDMVLVLMVIGMMMVMMMMTMTMMMMMMMSTVVERMRPTKPHPESQVRTASALFTQPSVPWRGSTAGPASQPVEKSWSQSHHLHKPPISESRSGKRYVIQLSRPPAHSLSLTNMRGNSSDMAVQRVTPCNRDASKRSFSFHSTNPEHSPILAFGNDAAAIRAGGLCDMLGGVHSACHPAATTVAGVVSQVGLTASSGDVAAVLVPESQQAGGTAADGDQHRW
jgi:hypothetical protein